MTYRRSCRGTDATAVMDHFYTPASAARQVVGAVGRLPPGSVADFAAGGGSLLIPAAQRWPKRVLLANDIDKLSRQAVSRNLPDSTVAGCDFLKSESTSRSAVLRLSRRNVALVLMNPPFTCRGGRTVKTSLCGTSVASSVAMAFVLKAVSEYLVRGGMLSVLLPSSSLTSRKDEHARSVLSQFGRFRSVSQLDGRIFKGALARTTLCTLRKERDLPAYPDVRVKTENKQACLWSARIIRGCTPVRKNKPDNGCGEYRSVVHTTELRSGGYPKLHGVVRTGRTVSGAVVLLPRVGTPSPEQIISVHFDEATLISECVIGLKCKSVEESEVLREAIVARWVELEGIYTGTCASYTTVDRLRDFLCCCGFE